MGDSRHFDGDGHAGLRPLGMLTQQRRRRTREASPVQWDPQFTRNHCIDDGPHADDAGNGHEPGNVPNIVQPLAPGAVP